MSNELLVRHYFSLSSEESDKETVCFVYKRFKEEEDEMSLHLSFLLTYFKQKVSLFDERF